MADRLIHILPEQVASQIAAGEVVERPASAIKELVENSLDAGARSISVEVKGGGAELIVVTDDGCGMGREDAIISLRRHATSKIRDAADLTAIRTLGFRGEALASIASVSHLNLRTRRSSDPHGVELAATAGDIGASRVSAMAPGTRIEVRKLFFNTPARLKFLKSVVAEQRAIIETIQRLALANYRVAFTLVADGRELIELPRAGSLLERLRQLSGEKLAAQMLPFTLERTGMKAYGLAAQSQLSFPTPRMVFTFVNHRSVRDRMLVKSIAQAYQTLLPRGRHPAAVLFVELRPEEVDVNVHPMKVEVRFRNPGAIFELAHRAIRDRLAGQFPDAAATVPMTSATEGSGGHRPLRLVPDFPAVPPSPVQPGLGLGYGDARRDGPGAGGGPSPPPAPGPSAVPAYSELKVLGQLFAGYIVLEGPDGLILIDQHAAHERVTFERLRAQLSDGGVQVQALLTPTLVELSPARAALVQAALTELRAVGFDLEAFGPTTILVKGTPAVFGADGGLRLLSDMIDSIGEAGLRHGGAIAFEDWLKQLACHGSVRVGRTLNHTEMRALLSDLDRTDFKTNCPHGRPVHIHFGRSQIERMFRR